MITGAPSVVGCGVITPFVKGVLVLVVVVVVAVTVEVLLVVVEAVVNNVVVVVPLNTARNAIAVTTGISER